MAIESKWLLRQGAPTPITTPKVTWCRGDFRIFWKFQRGDPYDIFEKIWKLFFGQNFRFSTLGNGFIKQIHPKNTEIITFLGYLISCGVKGTVLQTCFPQCPEYELLHLNLHIEDFPTIQVVFRLSIRTYLTLTFTALQHSLSPCSSN